MSEIVIINEVEMVVAKEAVVAKPGKCVIIVAVRAISLIPDGYLVEEPRVNAPTVEIVPEEATNKAKDSLVLTMRVFITLHAPVNPVSVYFRVAKRSNGVDFVGSGVMITVPVTLLKKN